MVPAPTADDARRPPPDLDARYQPLPPITAWCERAVNLSVFDTANAGWASLRDSTDQTLVRAAIDIAVRAAAFDTGAIEGLYATDRGVTFSVAVQSAAWEAVIAQESGRDAQRHFEAQLHAFELVLDAVTGRERISAAWLRALHEMTTEGQATYRALTAVGWQELPLPKGSYKSLPNHVLQPDGGWRSYAPVDEVQSEVQRLIDEINSPAFEAAHPVAQAAYVHHAFVGIHPFADGNGRVARALSSVFLYRAAWVPLLIFADERPRYLSALRAADDGDRAALVSFVRDVAVDTIELVSQRLRAARFGDPGTALRRLSDLGASAPADEAEVDRAARRVLGAVTEALHAELSTVPSTAARAALNIAGMFAGHPSVPGYERLLDSGNILNPTLRSPRVRSARVSRTVRTFVADHVESTFPVLVREDDQRLSDLRFRLTAVDPELTSAARQRIRDWATELVGGLVGELADRVEEATRGPVGEDVPDR